MVRTATMDATELVANLLLTTRGDAKRELAALPRLGTRLVEIEAHARATWPGVRIGAEAFFGHVGRHLPETGAPDALGQMHVADLYLAFACAAHNGPAVAALEWQVLPSVAPAVARIVDETAQVDDVMQNVLAKLLTGEAGQEPRILQYSGKGPLGAWLRVAAVRMALTLRRKRVDEPKTGEQLLARVPQSGDDIEIVHLRAQYAPEFEAAFQDSIGALSPRDRNLLHLHFIDGLTTDQIGLTYSVHGATVARWIGKARQSLFEGTKALLADRLSLTPAEFQSLMGLLLSQLDVSIRQLLAAAEPGRDGAAEG